MPLGRMPSRWLVAFLLALIFGSSFAITVAAQQNSKDKDSPRPAADPVILDPSKFDPHRPLAHELEASVPDGFTLIAVGDCITSRPLAQLRAKDPAFADALSTLGSGDVTYGNMETSILDMRDFKGYPYPGPEDMSLVADPGVAADLKTMGFDLVSRANNHALDWGVEGMRETSRWLNQAGIAWAGVGETQGLARAAQYFNGKTGRVAIVSMASTYRPGSDALPAQNAAPARPGINALSVKRTIVLPADAMKQLLALEHALYPNFHETLKPEDSVNGVPKKLSLFGAKFELGESFTYRYEMDKQDLENSLRAIRQGKQNSDFLIATIHSHEPATSVAPDPPNDFEDTPAPFLRELAEAAIDSGADAFFVTGIHHLGPIEVYKGKPIVYGLGNFFWSDIQEPISADQYQAGRTLLAEAFRHPERATDADLLNLENAGSFAGDPPFESMIVKSVFQKGKLSELRLYPIDLGYGKKLSESGIPRPASPEKASKILQRLQNLSVPYGTKIQMEKTGDGKQVGIIRTN
jgi:poly-gamma-glutamate capsule biosynthesis protein CapA/YwtB (metallophosphatase superfamily)